MLWKNLLKKMKTRTEEVKEYFVNLMCMAYSKEELVRGIWKGMSQKEREPHFRDYRDTDKNFFKDEKKTIKSMDEKQEY